MTPPNASNARSPLRPDATSDPDSGSDDPQAPQSGNDAGAKQAGAQRHPPGSPEAKKAWAKLKAARAAGEIPPRKAPPPAKPEPEPEPEDVRPPVQKAKPRRRHWMVVGSFVVMVLLPCLVVGWYLWARASDQYASYLGFSVRTEKVGSAIELLGGITEFSGSSSSDTDILYRFLTGQDLVAKVDAALDLRAIWSKGDPDVDPIFAYHAPGTLEDLTDYWQRMVKVSYDSGSKLIDLRVLAFTPEDAKAIAEEILRENSDMINTLSTIAREDALGYAREELATALERLKTSRRAMTQFRVENRIIDPDANIQGQVSLINTLQTQLATALIELDLLGGTGQPGDPRLAQARRKIEVIQTRIEGERRKLGSEGRADAGGAYAELVGQYEGLAVDRDFAEESYRAALAAYESAQAEARRQSRYLAAHVNPTLAQKSEYPTRFLLLGFVAMFLFLAWAISVLVAYSLKDRR